MGFFRQRKPRGFSHRYMFVDERKDRLKAIENRAKSELGMGEATGRGHEYIRGMFTGATKYAGRRRERRLSGGFVFSYGVILVLIVLLVAVWKLLLTM